jgi:hypothetical protein
VIAVALDKLQESEFTFDPKFGLAEKVAPPLPWETGEHGEAVFCGAIEKGCLGAGVDAHRVEAALDQAGKLSFGRKFAATRKRSEGHALQKDPLLAAGEKASFHA